VGRARSKSPRPENTPASSSSAGEEKSERKDGEASVGKSEEKEDEVMGEDGDAGEEGKSIAEAAVPQTTQPEKDSDGDTPIADADDDVKDPAAEATK
jgi:hypothetical protein